MGIYFGASGPDDADGPSQAAPAPARPPATPGLVRPYRETCADNPLLADCPTAMSDLGPAPARVPEDDDSGDDLSDDPTDELIGTFPLAENVLASHCGACHGPQLTEAQASAGINYMDDWAQLVRAGLILPCSPERSPVLELMRAGEMPPSGSGLPPVSDADMQAVEAAVDLGCANY